MVLFSQGMALPQRLLPPNSEHHPRSSPVLATDGSLGKYSARRDVRLYVDGDFESLETMEFWFDLLTERPDLKVYGYSKSWELFLEFDKNHEIPENYVLNLSSGSKYKTGPIRAAMMNLKNVRGEFVAVEAGKKPDAKTVRQAAKAFGMKKVFVCLASVARA